MDKIQGKIVGNPATTPMKVPDWDQNDERKSDYIKNRTHYDNRILIGEALSTDGQMSLSEPFNEGNSYVLELDGKVEEAIVSSGGDGSWSFHVSYMPFEIMYGYSGSNTLYVHDRSEINSYKLYRSEVVPLPEKYIPNSIARVADLNVKNTASGEAIKLTDSAESKAHILNVYGKTTQNGTPTPSAPLELESVGESVEVTFYKNDNESPTTYTLPTPNGLKGIPVNSGGNYTDSNGQKWICDEIDYNKGVYIQRIDEYRNTGTAMGMYTAVLNTNRNVVYWNEHIGEFNIKNNHGISTHFKICSDYSSAPYCFTTNCLSNNSYLYFTLSCDDLELGTKTTKEAIAAWIKATFSEENPLIVYYALETPIETPLTAEMIEAYTHYPTTTILSDKAGLSVGYVADTKNYIDNKFAALEAAIISTGGNV